MRVMIMLLPMMILDGDGDVRDHGDVHDRVHPTTSIGTGSSKQLRPKPDPELRAPGLKKDLKRSTPVSATLNPKPLKVLRV